jgi:hydroxymethylglutaryl-CoA lyase
MENVKIIECPRDAWKGLPKIIPTEAKVTYLRKLVEAGFRRIDAVSFVAPKYVPQMADSEAVMAKLAGAHLLRSAASDDSSQSASLSGSGAAPHRQSGALAVEIIGIVVNERGLERALATPNVATIGYPYSISAYFQRANANMSKEESRALVKKLQQVVDTPEAAGRNLVVYISMAFGNPYEEPWSAEIVEETLVWLKGIGVKTVSLADTVGRAQPEAVGHLFRAVKDSGAGMELGVHLHSRSESAAEKVLAAYEAGCRRFDSALTGLGGCPFAGDELVGNIPTELVVATLAARGVAVGIEPWALLSAVEATQEIRRNYASP